MLFRNFFLYLLNLIINKFNNFPTIIFRNEEHWEIKEDAKPFFKLLKKAKIFHESPNDAALHVEKIWDNVGDWWFSEEVQMARKNFCNEYSRENKNINNSLVNLFSNIHK